MGDDSMRGAMIWFNADKGHGFIRTEDDERLFVDAAGFAEGVDPGARCAGREVTFSRIVGDRGPQAVNVAYVVPTEQRRARLRRAR